MSFLAWQCQLFDTIATQRWTDRRARMRDMRACAFCFSPSDIKRLVNSSRVGSTAGGRARGEYPRVTACLDTLSDPDWVMGGGSKTGSGSFVDGTAPKRALMLEKSELRDEAAVDGLRAVCELGTVDDPELLADLESTTAEWPATSAALLAGEDPGAPGLESPLSKASSTEFACFVFRSPVWKLLFAFCRLRAACALCSARRLRRRGPLPAPVGGGGPWVFKEREGPAWAESWEGSAAVDARGNERRLAGISGRRVARSDMIARG